LFDTAYFFAWVVAFIIGIAWQKFCQAFVATALGDSTPRKEGRYTLNPFAHHTPLGLLFAFLTSLNTPLVAWGKPLPINTYAIRGRKLGYFLVSITVPLSTFFLAFIIWLASSPIITGSGILSSNRGNTDFLPNFLLDLIYVNLLLTAFNLIPIPPLGGWDILRSILPDDWNQRIQGFEEYGLLTLIVIVFFVPFFTRVNPLYAFVFNPIVVALFQMISGVRLL
jgi:Zn-dependent protease